MSTAHPEAGTTAFIDLAAMAMGLALLCAGTVTAIGGTGLLMWVLGL